MKKGLLILVLLMIGVFSLRAQSRVEYDLTMWTTGQTSLWDGNTIRYYGFGAGFLQPSVFPGPILYANEGDTVVVNVRNQSQRAPHTIHWHGLDVDQANDGMPQTSFVIYHLQDTHYTFIAPHAGTYLYHCHVASVIHVQMGMYGNFIVRPQGGGNEAWTGGPAFDQEYNWLLSEFDKSWHDTIPAHDSTDTAYAYFRIPPYEPDYFMVNGKSRQDLTTAGIQLNGQVGEKLYLRLSNVGFFMNRITFPSGLNAEVISSDGRRLPVPWDQDTLWLTPGERYGVMLTPSLEMEDSILVSYVNMNTYESLNTERVPVSINGFIGVAPEESLELTVFPNPHSGMFWIQAVQVTGESLDIEMIDLMGRKVKSTQWTQPRRGAAIAVETHDLNAGVYVVRVTGAKGSFRTKVLVE